MPDQIATYVQIASILVYVFTVFGLYKLLTTQKDATIQALNSQMDLLKLQLEQAEANTPDILVKSYYKRVNLLSDELSRLQADNQASNNDVNAKQNELEIANKDLAKLRAQIGRAEELLENFSCPFCKSPILDSELYYQVYEDGEIEIERITYECGFELVDGKESHQCGNLKIK